MCMEIVGKEEKVMKEEMLGLMEKKENIINGEVKLESDVKLVEIVLEKGIEVFGFIQEKDCKIEVQFLLVDIMEKLCIIDLMMDFKEKFVELLLLLKLINDNSVVIDNVDKDNVEKCVEVKIEGKEKVNVLMEKDKNKSGEKLLLEKGGNLNIERKCDIFDIGLNKINVIVLEFSKILCMEVFVFVLFKNFVLFFLVMCVLVRFFSKKEKY